MKLSEKLIKLRKEKGLSQEEFGNQINVSRQAVSKWENEETQPDIDKVKEIVKKFNVSYEYLLNEENEQEKDALNAVESNTKKTRRTIALKIFAIFILIYALICVYKFVAFYRFYSIAKSFSEENYWMLQDFKTWDGHNNYFSTTKVGDKILESAYCFEEQEEPKDSEKNKLPYEIDFTDIDKKIAYRLNYDKDKKAYIYYDRKEEQISEEEVEELFASKNENIVKNTTLGIIPSGFREIFLASIDPRYYYVSLGNRQFSVISFGENRKMKVQLNNDYLVDNVYYKFEYDGVMSSKFSYDYVQDHFSEIKSPIEEKCYEIIKE